MDTHLEEGLDPEAVDRWVQCASILHSNPDALDIAVKDGRIAGVRTVRSRPQLRSGHAEADRQLPRP